MRMRVSVIDPSPPTPEHLPREAVAEPGEPVWVGRTPAATLCVPGDAALDERHVLVVCYAGACRVFDASGRGVVVDGVAASEALLRDGSVVEAGATVVRVDVVGDEPAADVAARDLPADDGSADPDEEADPSGALAHRTAAQAVLRRAPGQLYAVLDAARRAPGVRWARASQELMAVIPDDTEELDYADAAPYLVRLAPESPLLDQLLRVGWGLAECAFLTSAAPFTELRAFLRDLMDARVDDGTEQGRRVLFRFYDPIVLARLLSRPEADAAAFFGPVRAWYVEEHASPSSIADDGANGVGEFHDADSPDDPEFWAEEPDALADWPPPNPGVLLEFRPQRRIMGGAVAGGATRAAVRVAAVRRAHELSRVDP